MQGKGGGSVDIAAQFEPVNAGLIGGCVHGVVPDDGLVCAEVPVDQTVHQTVGNRIQTLGGVGLRNAGARQGSIAGKLRVHIGGCNQQVGIVAGICAKGGVGRVQPVHMEFPDAQGVICVAKPGAVIPFHEVVGGADCRGGAIQVGG